MNNEKIKELADKIEENAWEIRADWSDPRTECRNIADLCQEIRDLIKID